MVKVTEIKERRQAFPQTSASTRNVGLNIARDIGKNIFQDMIRDIAHRSVVTAISQPRVLPSGGITFRPRMTPVLPPSASLRFDVMKTVHEKVYETMRTALENEWDIALAAAEGDEERVWRLLNFRVKVNITTAHDTYESWREGVHDDLVFAAALAAWRASKDVSTCAPILVDRKLSYWRQI